MSTDFHQQIRQAETGSLAERKEAAHRFYEAMAHDPALIAGRIEWLFAGHYGEGAYTQARQVAASPRMNRVAWLTLTIGAIEWSCPQRMAIAAWKKLTPAQKAKLDAAVKRELASHLKDNGGERDRKRPAKRKTAAKKKPKKRRAPAWRGRR